MLKFVNLSNVISNAQREQNCQSILKKLLTDYVVNESLFNDVESWIQVEKFLHTGAIVARLRLRLELHSICRKLVFTLKKPIFEFNKSC